MEKAAKVMPINELIAQTDKQMIAVGYSRKTMVAFREVWNVLKKYASERKEVYLTSELGTTMLKERYGFDIYEPNLNSYKKLMRRSVMLLLEFQLTGNIARRMLKQEHSFPKKYAEIGERFMRHLADNIGLAVGSLRNNHIILEKFFEFAVYHGVESPQDIAVPLSMPM